MPKIVDHDQRRREIARSTLDLVAADGIDGVTMTTVSQASGWSRGVLGHYFTNKDALLESTFTVAMAEVNARLTEAAAGPDATAALRACLEELLPLDRRRLGVARVTLAFLAETLGSDDVRQALARHHEAWRATVARAIRRAQTERGFAVGADPDGAADLLVAVTEGLRHRALIDPTFDRRRLRAELWRAVSALLG